MMPYVKILCCLASCHNLGIVGICSVETDLELLYMSAFIDSYLWVAYGLHRDPADLLAAVSAKLPKIQ